ncbi:MULTISPECIES: DUF2189 domain-containing protein [unclassified Wenzhouxiangella]|uniref:DUF2189 domain-containing protein n=1 Tax=unclassified Wenzhouxiangella TaxID=2613841 RepID=UPI000E32B276|nr:MULTISPECIES: DUF2189 domain-containing protein [unclassified Wenzhouxiangella]RFF28947.1 DUF2189 domain-containing protein [Wenzhouxiangella sp. 15181]RFP68344.1 DUF2189 domain-containing protein [Wenzhouxiangella sp. 15190]
MSEQDDPAGNSDELPFAAPCRRLSAIEPFGWLRLGWADLRAAPRQSLCYGVIMLLLSYGITAATWFFGNIGLYLGLVSGFVFVGPWLALTLYAISRRLENGRRVSLGRSMGDAARAVGNALIFAVILTVVFLVWARAATMVHVFFPPTENPGWSELLPFLAVGTAVGAVFSAIIFAASAFSLPMLMDRRTDTVTAVVTSVNAILRNKGAMAVWAAIIVGCVVVGAATAWLAFIVLLPLIGHATWHAYRRTIDASQWPLLD